MASSLLFFGVMMFMFGGLLLILWVGYSSVEQSRLQGALAQSEELLGGEPGGLLARSRFFQSERQPAGDPEPLDDAVVTSVEEYLQREMVLATRFVSEPSLETLYHHGDQEVELN